MQGERESVRRVFFQQVVFDQEDFVELIRRDFISERRDAFADDYGGERTLRLLHDLLRGGESLEAHFVPIAFALFRDEKNFHGYSTRASCRNFSISFAAISLGWPVMNSVFLVFCGM